MKKWNILSNESGVSEVIGTILLLGISVTLFSVVYISVLSFPGAPTMPSSSIAFSVNETSLILTHVGGKSLDLNSKVKIIIDDVPSIKTIKEYLDEEANLDLKINITQDNYWGFGEYFIIDFTEDVEDAIEVMIIDVDSNSLVMSGKKFIANRPPIISSPFPYDTSTDVSVYTSQINISISDPDNDAFNWIIGGKYVVYNSSNSDVNGMKSAKLQSLTLNTEIIWYVNVTDPTGSGLWINRSYTFTTEGNHPPTQGTPSPLDGSTDNSLGFSWNIPINDLEGNTFSWTIQCNGETNSGTGTNGTKTLDLSGLAYSTTYRVWVNATDPTPAGSGLWTNRSYIFTTAGNNPPAYGIPSPADGSTGNLLSLIWSIPINDTEGNLFNWTIQCKGYTASGTYSINGTKSLSLSGLSYSTTYRVWVNATDPTPAGSGLWTNRSYTFTTKANNRPVYGTPSPANGSTGNPLSLTWSIPINDPEGNLFNWTIQCKGYTASGTSSINGTKSLTLSGLSNNKWHTVWVNATDPTGSGLYIRRWYTFKT